MYELVRKQILSTKLLAARLSMEFFKIKKLTQRSNFHCSVHNSRTTHVRRRLRSRVTEATAALWRHRQRLRGPAVRLQPVVGRHDAVATATALHGPDRAVDTGHHWLEEHIRAVSVNDHYVCDFFFGGLHHLFPNCSTFFLVVLSRVRFSALACGAMALWDGTGDRGACKAVSVSLASRQTRIPQRRWVFKL